MNLKNELADKLQKEAEHFAGAKDLVGMLWDAGAALHNLHTENTALRATEDNLRQELQECQDQRRAAFRRIEELDRELDAMRTQIGQGVPMAWIRPSGKAMLEAGGYCTVYASDGMSNHSTPLYTHPAPQAAVEQQKPLTSDQVKDLCTQAGYNPASPTQQEADFINGIRHAEAAHGIVKE